MNILKFFWNRDSKTDCRRIKDTVAQNMDVEPVPLHIVGALNGERPWRKRNQYVAKDETVSVAKVIDYLLTVASTDPNRSITIASLPTYLYYCQGHYLASTGKALFSEDLLTPEGKDFKLRKLQVELVEKRYRRISEVTKKLTGKYPSLRPAHKAETDEQELQDQENAGVALEGLSRLQREAVNAVWKMYRDYSPNYLEFNFKVETDDGSRPYHGERDHEWQRKYFDADTVDLDWIRDNFSPLYSYGGSLLHVREETLT